MEKPERAKIAHKKGRAASSKQERCSVCKRLTTSCNRRSDNLSKRAEKIERHLLKSLSGEQRKRFEYYKKAAGIFNVHRISHSLMSRK